MRPSLTPLLVLAAACTAPAPQHPGPRGLRASDHLDAARMHAEAAEGARWPTPRPQPADGSIAASPEIAGMPWFYYWDPAVEHERLAAMHRAAAAELELEYQQACGDTPAADAAVSPIVRYAIGGQQVAGGAEVYLSIDAGTPDHVLASMRCHRAWMMLGRSMMDDCPLDLDGVEVVAHAVPGAVEVLLTVKDPTRVAELQRRTAMDVEAAARRRPPGR